MEVKKDPLETFKKFRNFEKTEQWKKWCKLNIANFNKNGTCFKETRRVFSDQDNEDEDEDEDNIAPNVIEQLFDREEYDRSLEEDSEYRDSDSEDEEQFDE